MASAAKFAGVFRSLTPLALSGLLLSFTLLAPAQEPPPARQLVVIVNQENPVTDLSLSDLRQIFRGERRFWKGNQPVLLLVPGRTTRERAAFLQLLYGTDEAGYRRHWIARQFRAENASQPIEIGTRRMMDSAVRNSHGSIAVIPNENVPADVKVVTIDGKLPGQAGYPLQLP